MFFPFIPFTMRRFRFLAGLFTCLGCLLLLPVRAQYPPAHAAAPLLIGAVDLHIHTAPDAFGRSVTDIEAAQLARDRGMAAIALKNHLSATAGRAELVNAVVPGIIVYGGIVLNEAVGGLNAQAVEAMARISPRYGRIVWLPTFDAAHHRAHMGQTGGISLLEGDRLRPEVQAVLEMVAQYDLLLATGHVSPAEVKAVVAAAKGLGIKRILVTHALADSPGLSLAELKALAAEGVCFELTYLSYLSGPQSHLPFLHANRHVSIAEMVAVIEAVGPAQVVLSTDLGQSGNPHPADGLLQFAGLLLQAGIEAADLQLMLRDNPARLVARD